MVAFGSPEERNPNVWREFKFQLVTASDQTRMLTVIFYFTQTNLSFSKIRNIWDSVCACWCYEFRRVPAIPKLPFWFFLEGWIGPPGLSTNQRDRIKMYELIKMERKMRVERLSGFKIQPNMTSLSGISLIVPYFYLLVSIYSLLKIMRSWCNRVQINKCGFFDLGLFQFNTSSCASC